MSNLYQPSPEISLDSSISEAPNIGANFVEYEPTIQTPEQVAAELEEAPFALAESFGQELASRLLRPNQKGELEMIVDRVGVVFLPGSRAVIFSPAATAPHIEKFLRQPITDLLNKTTGDMVPISLILENTKRHMMDGVDWDDRDKLTIHNYTKERGHNDTGPTIPQMRALLKARLVKESPDNVQTVDSLNDAQVSVMYNGYYPGGPQSGETRTGVNLVQPDGSEQNEAKPEFVGKVDDGVLGSFEEMVLHINKEVKLKAGATPPVVNLNEVYIQPLADKLNELIKTTMKEGDNGKMYGPYWMVNENRGKVIGSLLYKRINSEPATENRNLTPLVLSPDVAIFRGNRGSIGEKFEVFVLKKDDKDNWNGTVLHAKSYDESTHEALAYNIDAFMSEKA
ncbi:hypothetical protein A2V49_02790 [candidate division WWE3 bacterium RBG_19FT_COMBO_34_6]|uniref:Uncharacterized protein n=1 Tax=candidate division WWE3 bacterium RBG_19FT_COMBO_34_6 TaxID=1802612 RepID=A0A1F4UNE7_UNCKA|nr:MAG: hypothetical protein A2V49_02790 [candidate division WWE3 bacterium RBG_19FT_COMBO_34_6]